MKNAKYSINSTFLVFNFFEEKIQVTLLEGREKCEIKLTKPLKFMTGRIDCTSTFPKGEKFKTLHKEVNSEYLPSYLHPTYISKFVDFLSVEAT